jgi:hypothetical protein
MLFVKREQKASAKDYPNLALGTDNKFIRRVPTPAAVRKTVKKNAVPVVETQERYSSREKLIALAQSKLFSDKKYMKLSEFDYSTNVPVAERIVSNYEADTWVRKAMSNKTTRSITNSDKYYNSMNTLPYPTFGQAKKHIQEFVSIFYRKNTNDKDIYKFFMQTLANYGTTYASSYWTYSLSISDELLEYVVGKEDNFEFVEAKLFAMKPNDIHQLKQEEWQVLLYKAVMLEMPEATRNQVFEDTKFILLKLNSLAQIKNRASRVLNRKRNRKISPKNIKDVIASMSYNKYFEHVQFMLDRHQKMYKEVYQGTPTTNNLVEAIDDMSEFKVDYYGNVKPKDEGNDILDDTPSNVLPDWLTKDLSENILDEANKNYNSNFKVEGYGRGVHGRGLLHKFVPNRRDKVVEEKLHRQLSDAGVKPRNIHRILTDRKVFARRKKIAGGSVMIDCSGSMAWSIEQLREICRILPASKIAGYTGYSASDKRDGVMYQGDIRIIADKGKYDDNSLIELYKHGNNNVDLDAIKWLAQQEEPRIWVTDLQVVGVSTDSYKYIGKHCPETLNNEGRVEISRFMKKHNIIPIEKFEYVKEFATQYANFIG